MSGKRPEDVREKDVQGLKAPAALATFARGRLPTRQAGNRQLHFDQYCMLVLLFFVQSRGPFAAGHSAGEQIENYARAY